MKKNSYMLEDRRKRGSGERRGDKHQVIYKNRRVMTVNKTVHISCVLFNAITAGRVTEVICFVCYEDGKPKAGGALE